MVTTSPASSAGLLSPVALPQWPALRVLLTGAGGFIGSHLAERLVRIGARVRAFVHYNSRNDRGLLEYVDDDVQAALEIVLGDLTDATIVRRAVADCQLVFHLGALIAIPYSYQAPRHFIDTNVIGTLGKDIHRRNAGKILITIASFIAGSLSGVYNGTKAFLSLFSFVLREELNDTEVTVTCLYRALPTRISSGARR